MSTADPGRRPHRGRGTAVGIALLILVLAAWALKQRAASTSATSPAAVETPSAEPVESSTAVPATVEAPVAPIIPSAPVAIVPPVAAVTPPQPAGSTAYAQELLTGLLAIPRSTATPAEKAEQLARSFKLLVAQGPAAVPAIREYLERFQDLDFDATAEKRLGLPSLRIGLLDALGQVGSPEATDLLMQTLQKTSDSREIAWLAKDLEKQLPPDQLRPLALSAASDMLTQALAGQWDKRNIAPLFEVLQKYGDDSVVSLLERSVGKWNYYATLALAGLPDGAGIPALVRAAQDPAIQSSGNGDFALRPLAQAAMQYPEARAALVDQARLNQIPDSAWATVAASLAGTYIQYGDQILGRTAPTVAWTQTDINQRVALLDQVLAVTTSGPGKQALQTARTQVLSRTPAR